MIQKLNTTLILFYLNMHMILHQSHLSDTSPELVNQFLTWSKDNRMSCNPLNVGNLFLERKTIMRQYACAPISGIAQLKDLPLLGLIFQGYSKSSSHVKIKLTKANKCLHVLKTSRKEQYNQDEIDHMFMATVLINALYGLLVCYGASDSDLSLVQCFLKKCHKRYFISYPVDIFSLLKSQDCSIFRKSISIDGHPSQSDNTREKRNEI